MFHLSLPPTFLFLVFLGFLGARMLVLGVVLTRLSSGGSPKCRILVGCGTGCGLGCLGFLGLMVLLMAILVLTGSSLLRHGPVRSIQLERGTPILVDPGTHGERKVHPIHLRIEVRGTVHTSGLREWLKEETGDDVFFESTRTETPDGADRTRLDFWLRVPDGEMRRLERKLRRELPDLGLPGSITLTWGHDA